MANACFPPTSTLKGIAEDEELGQTANTTEDASARTFPKRLDAFLGEDLATSIDE